MRERLTGWTDRWIHAGDLTRTSLARYRVLYAVLALLEVVDFHWVTAFPDSMYAPPLGPMDLFTGFPPSAVLRALEALSTVCLVAVLVGWRTRTASFVLVAAHLLGFGFVYSLGKTNHNVLIVVAPALLALAGWGDRASVDAARRDGRGLERAPERAEQWPLRLFSLLVGLAFLTAALPKLRGGWLSVHTHAVEGFQVDQYYTQHRTALLADAFIHLHAPAFWEALDWATILLEGGMVLAVLTWRGTRVWFALAALFHAGVYLMMNINFSANVITYGFVVQWDRVPLPWWRTSAAAGARWVRAAPAVVVGGGLAWWAVGGLPGARTVQIPLVLAAGTLISLGYSAWLALRLLRRPAEPVHGRLLHDGDCGFCTRTAQWLGRRRPDRVQVLPWQSLPDVRALGLSEEDLSRRAYWQDSSGLLHPGSRAIAAAMVARGGSSAAAGRLLQSEPVAPLAALAYAWVAEHRHRLPGSTSACRVPAPIGPEAAAPVGAHHDAASGDGAPRAGA